MSETAPRYRLPAPTEHQECLAYIDWTQRVRYKGRPLYERIVHIPNERDKHKGKHNLGIHIAKLASEGVKKGFFDYVILAPFPDCGGLYLEAKRIRGSKTSQEQLDWRERYREFGYEAYICKGADELVKRTQEYFERHAAPGDWVNPVHFT